MTKKKKLGGIADVIIHSSPASTNNIKTVSIDKISYNDGIVEETVTTRSGKTKVKKTLGSNQNRAQGISPAKVSELADALKSKKNKNPLIPLEDQIPEVKVGAFDKKTKTYPLIYGNHRIRALKKMGHKKVRIEEVIHTHSIDRLHEQMVENRDLPIVNLPKPADVAMNVKEVIDMVKEEPSVATSRPALVPLIDIEERLADANTKKQAEEDLDTYIKRVSNWSGAKVQTTRRKVFKSKENPRVNSATSDEILESFGNKVEFDSKTKIITKVIEINNDIGWHPVNDNATKSWSTIVNNWRAIPLDNDGRVWSSTLGTAFKAKTNNPDVKVAVVFSYNFDNRNTESGRLDDLRESAIKAIAEVNASGMLKGGKPLIDAVYINGQKTGFNGENVKEEKCFKVKHTKAKKLKFDKNSVPKCGWEAQDWNNIDNDDED